MSSKTLKICAALAAIMVGVMLPADCAGAKATPKMGWKLAMKVSYFGRMEWAVSADGARLTSPMIAIVVRPPDFTMQMFNTETKKVKTFTKDKGFERLSMLKDSSMSRGKKEIVYSKWKMDGHETIAGLKCTKWTRHALNSIQDKTHYSELTEHVWMTPEFQVPHFKELMGPLSKLTNNAKAPSEGLCLRVSSDWKVFRRGNPKPEVDKTMMPMNTVECKRAMIDPAIFVFGKDYTPVEDEGEILFSDDGAVLPGHF